MAHIDELKRTARRHRIAYLDMTDGLDCGAHMAETLKPAATEHRLKYEAALAELEKIDPLFPQGAIVITARKANEQIRRLRAGLQEARDTLRDRFGPDDASVKACDVALCPPPLELAPIRVRHEIYGAAE